MGNQDSISSALKCCQILISLVINKAISFDNSDLISGVSLRKSIKRYGEKYKVKFTLRKLCFEKISTVKLPFAFQNKNGEFLILAAISCDKALLQAIDSPTPVAIPLDALKEMWNGCIISLKGQSVRFGLAWFIPAFLRYRRIIGEVILLSLMLQLLALATPLFFQVIMDKVLVHQVYSTLDVLIMVLVIVGIFEVVIKGGREYLSAHTTNRIDISLGIKLFRHLLGLPLIYFKHRQVGSIITRVQELDSIRDFLTGAMLTLCVDVVFTVIFFGVMVWISMPLTALVLAGLPLYFLLAWLSTAPLQQRIEQQFRLSALNTAFLNESVSGAETIKSLAVEPIMQRRWESQTADMVEAGFHSQTLNSLISHAVMLLQKITGISIIWWGAHMVISLEMTIGQLIAFNMMVSNVSQPIAKLIDLWQQYVQTRVAVDNLGEMLNLPIEQRHDSQSPPHPLNGELVMKQVVFRYQPDQLPVLQGVNLHIRAGETIGIVGPSGSGKSTLTRLLQKLYTPDEGEILIDGISLHQLDPCYLRSQIGVVLQENYLFKCTVRQNIAQKDPTAPLDSVVQAATLAGAHDFILQLPLGYDTVLAEGGSSLSGGQRQRIAIARALMSNPRVLIFDEATSALDEESQSRINENMAEIAKGRTVIIIAHRLSAVRNCHRIITLEQGCITESGEHEELITRGGCYARLWNQQQELRKDIL